VPPIANRDPLYVVRQLNDMQNGARTGNSMALMKQVVAKLTPRRHDRARGLCRIAGSISRRHRSLTRLPRWPGCPGHIFCVYEACYIDAIRRGGADRKEPLSWSTGGRAFGCHPPAIPFDAARLDHLMEHAGIDVLLATSKHNVQYLCSAATARSSSLHGLRWGFPAICGRGSTQRAHRGKAAFFGHRLEKFSTRGGPVLDAGKNRRVRFRRRDGARRPTICASRA